MITRSINTALATLFATSILFVATQSNADVIAYWPLDETTGTSAPNSITASTYPDGTLINGPAWTADGTRGQVLAFDGSNDRVDAGDIPALSNAADFSISFWSNQAAGQADNNDVILVSRAEIAGGGWLKFTPSKLEIRNETGGTGTDFADIDYANFADDTWVHNVMVKDGGTITYYRNGTSAGSVSATSDLNTVHFQMGGDQGFGEAWEGRLDDVALFDMALSSSDVAGLADGSLSPLDFLPASATPEPASFALAALGLMLLGMTRRRRRR